MSGPGEPLLDGATQLARLVLDDDQSPEVVLQLVVDLAVAIVPGFHRASATWRTQRALLMAASDESVLSLERLQFEHGGPSVVAIEASRPEAVDDVTAAEEHPALGEAVTAAGVRDVVSVPLPGSAVAVGALSIYATEESTWSESEERALAGFAHQAGTVLANAQIVWDARAVEGQLREAMASRAAIEQAKGILMARQRCSPDEAFEVLRRASQARNRKVRDLAAEIVQSAVVDVPREDGVGLDPIH